MDRVPLALVILGTQFGRSASCPRVGRDAERPHAGSHAERGNQDKRRPAHG